MMRVSIWVKSISFNSETTLSLENDTITVFVGPNNSGKSVTLIDIFHMIAANYKGVKAVNSIELEKSGTFEELKKQLEHRRRGNQYYFPVQSSSNAVSEAQLESAWSQFPGNRSFLPTYFSFNLSTANRLQLVEAAPAFNYVEQLPTNPIQHLKADEELEKRFSKHFKKAFGEEIIVNHGSGAIIPLHVGCRPVPSLDKDRVSKAYLEELQLLPLLQNQGDGMKSFAGVFLSLFVTDFSIIVFDEPEAFLHPPQQKLLGQMVAKDLSVGKQFFIATHSEHFLKGLMDYAKDRLNIVRIQRQDDNNFINLLRSRDIHTIWGDPLLRHSNVLDGLFHSMVILCESDSDCRFFSAILTAIVEHDDISYPDVLFVASGGKHRFPVVVKALNKINVPMSVIGDFDFFSDENPVKAIYEEFGGEWSSIDKNFQIVKRTISQRRPELDVTKLKEDVNVIISQVKGSILDDQSNADIRKLLKKSSAWAEAKSAGKALLGAGDATISFNSIQAEFEKKAHFHFRNGGVGSI